MLYAPVAPSSTLPLVDFLYCVTCQRKLTSPCTQPSTISLIIENWCKQPVVFFYSLYRPVSQSFEFDHHYPKSENNSVAVVLYAVIGSESFWKFHQHLEHLAKYENVHYILRHYLQVILYNNINHTVMVLDHHQYLIHSCVMDSLNLGYF